MKTATNLEANKADQVFEMTRFNYDAQIVENEDGTININFDSKQDLVKFLSIYNTI